MAADKSICRHMIVFTDLDGTLLDHDTYRYDDALEGIGLLRRERIPLILISSKTEYEMEEIHRELSLQAPFIFENGAGIARPGLGGYEIKILSTFSLSYIAEALEEFNARSNAVIKAMIHLSPEEIAELTGLTAEKAALAKKRLASVPFIADETIDCGEADSILTKKGLRIIKGARFYHLLPAGIDKGTAVEVIRREYENREGVGYHTAGIGDGYNDIRLFESVDMPYLVRKKDGNYIESGINGIQVTDETGPAGFTAAVKDIIYNKEKIYGNC